jgi:hypothetical protein
MTIMLAGGMVIASPGMVPMAHAANANLFVSAENSQFDNYMSGPQVIEVVVIDSDINDTDQAKGEPDVTVNGKILRMVQGVDGNWYGYFADRKMAQIADSTTTVAGEGLDFGQFCSATTGGLVVGVSVADTNGIAVPTLATGVNGSAIGASITAACADGDHAKTPSNVVREAKGPNTTIPAGGAANLEINSNTINTGAVAAGQIGIESNMWPFIQLYTLNPTGNVVVQYNKGGGVQSTTLTFDTVDNFASASLDRAVYPQGSQVHATITDLWLNIDPTDEDSWTFGTTGTDADVSAITAYQVFDENGSQQGDTATNTDADLTNTLDDLMCEDNCRLLTNADVQGKGFVITLADNDDSEIRANLGSSQNPLNWETLGNQISANVPVTITEQGPNSGVFGTYDESDTSAIIITDNAKRGTSASITYNEDSYTILVGLSFGSVDIQPTDDEWNSGEEIPITIVWRCKQKQQSRRRLGSKRSSSHINSIIKNRLTKHSIWSKPK